MAKKTKRAKLIEEYAIKVQTLETESEKKALLDKLNKDLEAIGEPPMLDLTEEERRAKKEREDAEECCGIREDDGIKRNSVGIDETIRPEWAGMVKQQYAMGGLWNVKYNDKGRIESYWKD